jgi:hypothetical protein
MSSVTKYNGSWCRNSLWRSAISFFLSWVGRSEFCFDWTVGAKQLFGISTRLEKKVDEDWPIVAESLEDIWTTLLAWKDAIVNLTTNDRILNYIEFHVTTLLNTLCEHRWCKFISVAKCKGLYQFFFHIVNWIDEFFHLKFLLFLDLNTQSCHIELHEMFLLMKSFQWSIWLFAYENDKYLWNSCM